VQCLVATNCKLFFHSSGNGTETALTVNGAKGRVAKIMIVAMARKLLVALWRFAEDGVIPEGATMKAA
jgi:hypothetical protein